MKVKLRHAMLPLFFCLFIFLGGCVDIPIKDGELELSKDMSAGLEDDAVARITNRF